MVKYMERTKLPFRKNCEGYFLNNENKLLAKLNQKEFVMFPGGGIESNENEEEALKRETFEETGIEVENLKLLCVKKFIWDSNWAHTPKQKDRYLKYQGDEMYFFTGNVKKITNINTNEEDYWKGEKFMSIKKVLEHINMRLEKENNSEYILIQQKLLKNLK